MTIVYRPRGLVEPPLAEVLAILGPKALALEWRVVSAQGGGPVVDAERFLRWQETKEWVEGHLFVEVATRGMESFWGEVCARRMGAKAVALSMRATPHKGWDIEADEGALVAGLLGAFPGAVPGQTGAFHLPHLTPRRKEEAPESVAEPPAPDPLDDLLSPTKGERHASP